ncbi:MAG: glycoside hydrolase family 99-like domain-containing protein [Caldimicrobium sp.]
MRNNILKTAIYILFLFWAGVSFAESFCPLIGAIRWDAWHGKTGKVGQYVEKVLSDPKWYYRLPFCSEIMEDSININCATVEAMNKEVEYANYGKIDYWAFLVYPPNSEMSEQLKLYLSNTQKFKPKFTVIIEFGRYSPQNFRDRNDYYLEIMKKNTYLKINNRPVVFIFNIDEKRLQDLWGEEENFKMVINDLTTKVKEAGFDKPYYIVMDFNPEKASKWVDMFGFDAISTYATHPGKRGTYQDLVKHTQKEWERAKRTGKTVIPIVMSGWDPRPRGENPPPWATKEYIKKAGEVYFLGPTPEDISQHVRKAINWAKENNSPLIIIYAWNEFDEGGWIMPTLLNGSERLRAIREVIEEECAR